MKVVNRIESTDKENKDGVMIIESSPTGRYREVLVGIKIPTPEPDKFDYMEMTVSGEDVIKAVTNAMNR